MILNMLFVSSPGQCLSCAQPPSRAECGCVTAGQYHN